MRTIIGLLLIAVVYSMPRQCHEACDKCDHCTEHHDHLRTLNETEELYPYNCISKLDEVIMCFRDV